MSRDIVVLRSTGRASRVTPTDSTYTGIATETGPVADRLFEEVDTTTSAPVNLVLSSDTLFNNVYVAATWDPAPDPNVVGYQVVFARAGVSNTFRVETEAAWFEPAMGGEDYDVTVSNVYVNGVLGANTVTDSITAATDNTIPGVPSGLSLGTGIRSITISWDENTELDMEYGLGQYSVQLSNDGTFAGPDILVEKKVGALVTSFTDLDTNVQYWARVAAVDTSGNISAYSGALSGTTGEVQGTDIADLAITNAKIANATIGYAKIIELQANQLIAGSGFVNELTVASGGAIKSSDYDAAPTVNGWRIGTNSAVFNNVTIRGTLSGATGTFAGSLSAATGSFAGSLSAATGTFAGSISAASGTFTGDLSGSDISGATITGSSLTTSDSGKRVEMVSDDVRFYDSTGTLRGILEGTSTGVFFDLTTGGADDLDIAADNIDIDAIQTIGMTAPNGMDFSSSVGDIDITAGGSTFSIYLNSAGTGTSDGVDLQKNGTTCVRAIYSSVYSDPIAVLRRRSNTSSTGFADLGFGIVGTYSSRAELKEWTRTVEPEVARDRIMAYRPVDWAYKADVYPDNPFHGLRPSRGFVVEEVAAVDENAVDYNWVDKDDRTQMAHLPDAKQIREEGFDTLEEWLDSHYPMESAEPTMWNHFAILADVVAHNQLLEKRVAALEAAA